MVGREFGDPILVELGEVIDPKSRLGVDGADPRWVSWREKTEDLTRVLTGVVKVDVSNSVSGVEVGSFREGRSWSFEIGEIESLVESSVESSRDGLVEGTRRSEGEESSDDERDLGEGRKEGNKVSFSSFEGREEKGRVSKLTCSS